MEGIGVYIPRRRKIRYSFRSKEDGGIYSGEGDTFAEAMQKAHREYEKKRTAQTN
jgi:hypothetical protein